MPRKPTPRVVRIPEPEPHDKSERVQRVVFTGGPAAGKTAILDVLRRHLRDRVAVLPEAATTLFVGGFPRPTDPAGRRLVQQAIFTVQRSLEGIYAIEQPSCPHICDRGGLDGAAYWPGGLDRFLGAMGTTLDSEYRRYDAVIFLETSAAGENSYPRDNPHRVESPEQARRIDCALREIWQHHPRFYFIGHEVEFYEKVAASLLTLTGLLNLENHVKPAAVEGAAAEVKRASAPPRAQKRARSPQPEEA
jgi:hypothetical protein